MQRDSMQYDVVIAGGGPAGLAAAIRLRQLATAAGRELTVCVLEKGSEVGAHILSGALLDPRALDELLPEWRTSGAPVQAPVSAEETWLLTAADKAIRIPHAFVPRPMRNRGNYAISLGNLSRWLAAQAEALGAEIFAGFPAAEVLFDEQGAIAGVITGDQGRGADGNPKSTFQPGMELCAHYTIFAEGSRGHLGKRLIKRYGLDAGIDPQHYAIGLKELWDIDPARHRPGLVIHGSGWPLRESGASGGFFLYHLENSQVSVGLVVDLNYANPYLSPYEEFQRCKRHPVIRRHIEGGRCVAYGARAISKGGLNSLPRMVMPGGILVGCDAGTLNNAKIKGTHTAMKSGMLAAESIFAALSSGDPGGGRLDDYTRRFRESWLNEELHASRNFGAALHRFGLYGGALFNLVDQNLCGGRLPVTIRDRIPDHATLLHKDRCRRIDYPRPDKVVAFDRLSSLYLSNTGHEEDQPCHLALRDRDIPLATNLRLYEAPEQRYCPAGVYEIVGADTATPRLQINAQNCLHCKTCDIKDPSQNIDWLPPEGGGGPNFPNM